MRDFPDDRIVPRRSEGTKEMLRERQPWPPERPFEVLNEGGILGLLPALVLSELECRFLDDEPTGRHFDMIADTSTGGVLEGGST